MFWSIVLLFTVPVTVRHITDVDIWWHLQLGRSILDTGHWPDLRDFYWSPVSNYAPTDIRFSFLGDIAFQLLFKVGGAASMQLAVLGFVLGSCFLLVHIGAMKVRGGLIVVLLFVAGTYQLQIMRNAVFGLPGTVLICWLWWLAHFRGRERAIWWIPPLLGLWSGLHGSYLFGFGLLVLFCGGEFLDRLRGLAALDPRFVIRHGAVLLCSYLAILIYNPYTIALSRLFLKFLIGSWYFIGILLALIGLAFLAYRRAMGRLAPETRRRWLNGGIWVLLALVLLAWCSWQFSTYTVAARQLAKLPLRSYGAAIDTAAMGLGGRIKHGLNNTFWKADKDIYNSLDFISPFDFAGDLYVWSSLVLLALGLAALILARRQRLSLLIPFAVITILGLGYVRTIGFIAIFASFVFFALGRAGETRLRIPAKLDLGLACLLVATLLAGFGFQRNWLGLYLDHRVGFGAASFFPKETTALALAEFEHQPVFTTLENGGYLLYHWFPKKVFIDGFLPPHNGETTDLYELARTNRNPELLHNAFKTRIAHIGVRDPDWFPAFIDNDYWTPWAVDTGAVLFLREGAILPRNFRFHCLMTEADLARTPDYQKELLAVRLYQIGVGLISSGYKGEAKRLLETPDTVVAGLLPLAPEVFRDSWQQTLSHFEGYYPEDMDPHISIEFRYIRAMNTGNWQSAIPLGKLLLRTQPKRPDLLAGLAKAMAAIGDHAMADQYRERLKKLQSP